MLPYRLNGISNLSRENQTPQFPVTSLLGHLSSSVVFLQFGKGRLYMIGRTFFSASSYNIIDYLYYGDPLPYFAIRLESKYMIH